MRPTFAHSVLLATALLVSHEHMLNAQLAPGERVRVRRLTPCCTITLTGTLIAATPASLSFRADSGLGVVLLPRDSVASLEVGTVVGYQTLVGAGIGLLTGAAVGVFFGGFDSCPATGECMRGLGMALGAVGGGLLGLATGAIIGRHVDNVVWERVELPRRRDADASPSARGRVPVEDPAGPVQYQGCRGEQSDSLTSDCHFDAHSRVPAPPWRDCLLLACVDHRTQ